MMRMMNNMIVGLIVLGAGPDTGAGRIVGAGIREGRIDDAGEGAGGGTGSS